MTGPAELLRRLDQAGPADRELVARFVAQLDHGAFEELVRRHGPVVFGVCRRVTGHSQDAEDAFQAVFLVLARKARRIGNPDLLGNWLYGVAVRVARKARRSAARRLAREVQVTTMPEPPDTRGLTPPGSPSDFEPILDEELAALPVWYRDAILLCDIRGVSREEAAILLGVPEGTLSSRLANGRKKLAARLTRRGIALSTATFAVAVGQVQAGALVPSELIAKTCGLVANYSAGGTVPPLARLAEGGFAVRNSLLLGLVAATFAIAGIVVAANSGDQPPPGAPDRPRAITKGEPAPDAKPDDKPEEKVAYSTQPRMQVARDLKLGDVGSIAWSPDGNIIAVRGSVRTVAGLDSVVNVTSTSFHQNEGNTLEVPLAGSSQLIGFTSNGKELVTDQREYNLVSGFHRLRFMETSFAPNRAYVNHLEPRTVNLDAYDTHGYAFAADAKTFRTIAYERDGSGNPKKLEVREVDAATGRTLKSLMKTDFVEHMLSPNGKRLATVDKDGKVLVYNVDRGAKLSTYALAEPPSLPSIVSSGYGSFGGGFSGGQPVTPSLRVSLVFSPDASRLVVSRAIGQTVVINTETGEALPVLEGSEMMRTNPTTTAFTGDGRLLAMTGSHYTLTKINTGGPKGGRDQPALTHSRSFLTVWDTQTGKVLKSWDRTPLVAFNPARPVLAILEPNGENTTRLGLWDFSAEVAKK